MLSPTEAAARNRAVTLRLADKTLARLDPVTVANEAVNRDKRSAARILPTCKPEARAPRKIYKGGKPVAARSHHVNTAMPGVIGERMAPRNGLTNWVK